MLGSHYTLSFPPKVGRVTRQGSMSSYLDAAKSPPRKNVTPDNSQQQQDKVMTPERNKTDTTKTSTSTNNKQHKSINDVLKETEDSKTRRDFKNHQKA